MARKSRPNKPGKPRNKRAGRPRGKHSKGEGSNKDTNYEDKNDSFKIKMKAMANGGFALGTNKRRTTFIPYTIPGETVRAVELDQSQLGLGPGDAVAALRVAGHLVVELAGVGRGVGAPVVHPKDVAVAEDGVVEALIALPRPIVNDSYLTLHGPVEDEPDPLQCIDEILVRQ